MTAITAITAQSTTRVEAIHLVPPEIVLAQVRAVARDIGVDAVKVGMLGTAEIALAVAQALEELPAGTPVVVDPVMIAESGARLLAPDAQQVLIEELLPRATVLTPNLPEARALAGWPSEAPDEDVEADALARAVLALGPRSVVLTGGHRARAVDLFIERPPAGDEARAGERDAQAEEQAPSGERDTGAHHGYGQLVEIPGERHPDGAAHGSGCTHSAVLAARLALGSTPLQAARVARALAGEAVAQGLRELGSGAGPVDVLGLDRARSRLP
jgi:hydroxymethylpyrimidine/phosphomethylpyrimidine kinase